MNRSMLTVKNRPFPRFATAALCTTLLTSAWTGTSQAASITSGQIDPATDPSTWNAYTNATVGVSLPGTLDINGGSSVDINSLTLGNSFGSQGTANISGTGSRLNTGHLWVAESGRGTLNITNGAGMSNTGWVYLGSKSGSRGDLLVDGPGSRFDIGWGLYAGYRGVGTLSIRNGGVVTSDGGSSGSTIGSGGTSTGVVTVDGPGSKWINKNLYVGDNGKGTLSITNAGTVQSDDASIRGSKSEATVSGVGSQWITQNIGVGWFANNNSTLLIEDGGFVASGSSVSTANGGVIQMRTGAALAIQGDADESLADFYQLISYTDNLTYWNGSTWASLTEATQGVDYDLTYYDSPINSMIGDFDAFGYTVLTVGVVPEPTSLALLGIGGLALTRRRRG